MRFKKALAMARLSLLATLASIGISNGAHATGTDIGKPWFFGAGIGCDASLLPWRSVWLGHFSGGSATYVTGAPAASVVWQDQKLCFPSRRECMAWQRAERRQFGGIEGYWTCLLLR
jgi:hypothetical protein